MSIDWSKPVRTKGGKIPVEIVTTKGRGDFPVFGYVGSNPLLQLWDLSGNWAFADTGLDLENVPETIEKTMWVNVYPDGNAYMHREILTAKQVSDHKLTARVKVNLKFKEGQFGE